MPDLAVTVSSVPMKISEIILLPEQDWRLKRTSGSHRHVTHPVKPGPADLDGRRARHREDPAGHRAAQSCRYPDGTQVLCCTVLEVRDGRISRQVAMQAWEG
jgi:hypothetical protein